MVCIAAKDGPEGGGYHGVTAEVRACREVIGQEVLSCCLPWAAAQGPARILTSRAAEGCLVGEIWRCWQGGFTWVGGTARGAEANPLATVDSSKSPKRRAGAGAAV